MKMTRLLSVLFLALAACGVASARQRIPVSCQQGGVTLSVPGWAQPYPSNDRLVRWMRDFSLSDWNPQTRSSIL